MGRRVKLGEICGYAIFRVFYSYQPGYFEMLDGSGNVIKRTETPVGFFAAAVRAVRGAV